MCVCVEGGGGGRSEKVALYFGVCKMFTLPWVDLLAAQPAKSSSNIHFVYPISLSFIPTSFPFYLYLPVSPGWFDWLLPTCERTTVLVRGPQRLTAQPSHLRHRLNKQHDLPIKKAFTLIILKQDLNTTCSFSCRMPKVLTNANQPVLSCLKMKNYERRWRQFFYFIQFFCFSLLLNEQWVEDERGENGKRPRQTEVYKNKKTNLFYRFSWVVNIQWCPSVNNWMSHQCSRMPSSNFG